MAIQRMYTGRGGAVQFDRPAITPTEISQQYGRSMVDILKYKQTMQQRRKEGILKLTDIGVTEGLMGESQARQAQRMDEFRKKTVGIMESQIAAGGDPYNLPSSAMMQILAEKREVAQAGEKELKVQGEFIKAQTLMAADAASAQPKYDQEHYEKAVEYYRTHEGEYPPGGFIKSKKLDITTILYRNLTDIKAVGTGEFLPPTATGIITEKQTWDEAAIKEKAAFDYRAAPELIKDEYGGIEGYKDVIRKELGVVPKKKAYKPAVKEEPELGTVRAVPGASTSKDIKVMPGREETKQMMGEEGKVKNYDVDYVNEIQGFKGEVTLSPGGILKTTDVEMLDIKAGEVLGEKRYRKGDEIKGENLVGYSFKTVQVPAVVGYKVLTGEDMIIYKKNRWGKDVKDYIIKTGSQVDRKQLADMSEEQRKKVVTKPFVDVVVHSAAYKNFTVSEPLTKAWKRKLSLSDAAYNNYLKGYSAEGAPAGVADDDARGGVY